MADKPTAGFEFVQLKVSPPPVFAVKLIAGTASPEQTETFAITATTGCGLIVMVNDFEFEPLLVQLFFVAVTVTVLTISTPVKLLGAVYAAMLPDPEAASPTAVFVFVQLNVSDPPVLAEKLIAVIASPEQTETFGTTATTGCGLTVMVNVFMFAPTLRQLFLVAVIVNVATISTPVKLFGAVKAAIFPIPVAAKPTEMLLFDQLKVSPPPVFAEKGIAAIGSPEQTETFVTALTTGCGLIVIVNVFVLAPILMQLFLVADTVIVPTISTPVKFIGAV